MFSKFQKSIYLGRGPKGLGWVLSFTPAVGSFEQLRTFRVFRRKDEALNVAAALKADPDVVYWEVWIDPIARGSNRRSVTSQKVDWVDPEKILPV